MLLAALLCAAAAAPLVPHAPLPRNDTGYEARRAQYLADAVEGTDLWGDLARLTLNEGPLAEDGFYQAMDRFDNRIDGADFNFPAVARILNQHWDSPLLRPELKVEFKNSILGAKFFMDEPGPDGNLQYWSENHQILYHCGMYLVGHAFAADNFTNSGMTGAELSAKGRDLALIWLERRFKVGFSEFNSDTYLPHVIAPVAAIAELAPDELVATRAAMVLDTMLFDVILHSHAGIIGGFRGRAYPSGKFDALGQSTRSVVWLLTGEGRPGTAQKAAMSLALSVRYQAPRAIVAIGEARPAQFVTQGRVGIDPSEGPDALGMGYTDPYDGIAWHGMGAYAHPLTVEFFFIMGDAFDMWDHEVYEQLSIFRPLAGKDILPRLMEAFAPISTGSALGPINLYTFKTPDVALGTAVDFRKGSAAFQAHTWTAVLDEETTVFVTHPGPLDGDYSLAYWTGGLSQPNARQFENVLIALYNPPYPTPLDLVLADFTHAWLPRADFDEFVEHESGWRFGRKGDAFVALYSSQPTTWSVEDERELIAEGAQGVWICEVGSTAMDGSFAAFVERIAGGEVAVTAEPVDVEPGTEGIATCMLFNNCLEGLPDDFGNVIDCLVRIPVTNPNPACEDYADAVDLARCAADCAADDTACLVLCVVDNIVLNPPALVEGVLAVTYTDAAGRKMTVGWTDDLVVERPGEDAFTVPIVGARYENQYAQTEWMAEQIRIEKDGQAVVLDFEAGVRELIE